MGMDSNRGNGWTAVDWAKLAGVAVVGGLGLSAVSRGIKMSRFAKDTGKEWYTAAKSASTHRENSPIGNWIRSLDEDLLQARKRGDLDAVKSFEGRITKQEDRLYETWPYGDITSTKTDFWGRHTNMTEVGRRRIFEAGKGINKVKDANDFMKSQYYKNVGGVTNWFKKNWAGEGGAASLLQKGMASRATSLNLKDPEAAMKWVGRGMTVGDNSKWINRGSMVGVGYLGASWAFGD
jgi:hypothetical protein